MKTNKIVLTLILCVCALATHFVLKPEQADALPEFEPATTLVVELLPNAPGGEALVLTKEIQDRTAEIFRKRLDPEGDKNIVIRSQGLNQLIIGIPEETDLAQVKAVIQKSGRLEFRESILKPETTEVEWVTRLDGSSIEAAAANFNKDIGSWSISIDMTAQGKQDFAELTKELLGKPLGIFFDGKQISAPIIQSAITGGQAVVTGRFTQKEATEIASYLNAGGLPVKVKLVSTSTE